MQAVPLSCAARWSVRNPAPVSLVRLAGAMVLLVRRSWTLKNPFFDEEGRPGSSSAGGFHHKQKWIHSPSSRKFFAVEARLSGRGGPGPE